jgi:hypothetical protein
MRDPSEATFDGDVGRPSQRGLKLVEGKPMERVDDRRSADPGRCHPSQGSCLATVRVNDVEAPPAEFMRQLVKSPKVRLRVQFRAQMA